MKLQLHHGVSPSPLLGDNLGYPTVWCSESTVCVELEFTWSLLQSCASSLSRQYAAKAQPFV